MRVDDGPLWLQALFAVLWLSIMAALGVAMVAGLWAIKRAHTRNRLKSAGWITVWLEPEAFRGDAARYRRWSNRAMLVFLALWAIGAAAVSILKGL